MAKKIYVGVDNVARKVKKGYVGVETLPEGYTPVEYIESSGKQYIKTGFKPNQDTRVVCDFQMLSNGVGQTVFGAWMFDSNYVVTNAYLLQCSSSDYFTAWYGTDSAVDFDSSLPFSDRHLCDMDKENCLIDEYSVTNTSQTFSSSYELYLFGANFGGSIYERASVRIWSTKIYDNGTLVRNYVPCIDASGTVGMYETVNSEFKANSGSGVFTAGDILPTSVARKIIKGYVGIGGVARPFMSAGPIEYYGYTNNTFPNSVANLASTTVMNYAIFVGGMGGTSGSTTYSNGRAYNTSLTETSIDISTKMAYHGATTIQQYALFGGGGSQSTANNGGSVSNVVKYINGSSLTVSTASSLRTSTTGVGATSNFSRAIFAGGYSSSWTASKIVTAYDGGMTRSSASDLPLSSFKPSAAKCGQYAVFICGTTSVGYDGTLTASTFSSSFCANGYQNPVATSIGNYGLFPHLSTEQISAINSSFTITYINGTAIRGSNNIATTIDDSYALIGCGYQSGYLNSVDVFDNSLTRIMTLNIDKGRSGASASSIGNYALIACGGGSPNTVEVLMVA